MSTRPTYESIAPVAVGPFNSRQRRESVRQAKWNAAIVPLPAAFDAKSLVQPTAVATIRKAFTLARTGRDSWLTAQRTGRIDIRQGIRAVRGEQDVFKAKKGQSVTRVRCAVLIDASGSMHQGLTTIPHPTVPGQQVSVHNSVGAAAFGATIAEALGRVPSVDLDVYQHAATGKHLTLKWRWSKGTPVGVFNEAATGIGGGGNADGHAVYAIAEKMRREAKRGERNVILVVSDGLPSQTPLMGDAGWTPANGAERERMAKEALVAAVDHARKHGIAVIAVAIDGSSQEALYGAANYIAFEKGNWTALGSALGRVLGKALARR